MTKSLTFLGDSLINLHCSPVPCHQSALPFGVGPGRQGGCELTCSKIHNQLFLTRGIRQVMFKWWQFQSLITVSGSGTMCTQGTCILTSFLAWEICKGCETSQPTPGGRTPSEKSTVYFSELEVLCCVFYSGLSETGSKAESSCFCLQHHPNPYHDPNPTSLPLSIHLPMTTQHKVDKAGADV